MNLHPSELIRLLNHYEKHVNRVGLFIEHALVNTGDPDDQIIVEDLYESWKKWRHKFAISEAAFRSHLRGLKLDMFEDGDGALLIGFVRAGTKKLPPKTQRTLADFPMEKLDKVMHLCATVEGLSEALGWPPTTLRDWMYRYPELDTKIRDGLAAANASRGAPRPSMGTSYIARPYGRRSPELKLATARKYGFASYEDYSRALQAKNRYLRAKRDADPLAEEYRQLWQEAESKKKGVRC